MRLIAVGFLKTLAAFAISWAAWIGIGWLHLGTLPAVGIAFAAGCLAGWLSVPGYTQMADLLSLIMGAVGMGAGPAVLILALGVPVESIAPWFFPSFVAFMTGMTGVAIYRRRRASGGQRTG